MLAHRRRCCASIDQTLSQHLTFTRQWHTPVLMLGRRYGLWPNNETTFWSIYRDLCERANKRHSPNVVLKMGQRLRHCSNIKPTLAQSIMSAELLHRRMGTGV